MRRALVPLAAALLLASSARAQTLLLDGADPDVRPQDDLYGHVNGRWERETPIPPGLSDIGSFPEVEAQLQADVIALLQDAAAGTLEADGASALATFYAAVRDTAVAEALGLAPLRGELAFIRELSGPGDFALYFGHAQRLRSSVPFQALVLPDARDTEVPRLTLLPSGLGLGAPPFYRVPAFEGLREAYRSYAETLLRAAGTPDPALGADRVVALERRLADAWAAEAHRMRSREASYNRLSLPEADSVAPGLDWRAFYDGLGTDRDEPVNVWLPEHADAVGRLLHEVPVEDWRAYLTVRLLDGYAEALPRALRDAHFALHGRARNGAEAPPTADERAVRLANSALGWTLGRAYVERHVGPDPRRRVEAVAAHVRDAFVAAVERNDWMRPETKAEAIAKARNMGLRIGHPDAWPDERSVRPDSVDLVATLLRADRLAWARQTDRLGAPHDPDAWAFLPQTFYAYYATPEPGIVFPAGILQPPFFWPDEDDAVTYGTIGVVIGHELTHGFDDRGRHTDARGDLRDWWHPDDAAEYRRRAERVVEQFSAEEPLPGLRIDGRRTLGENLADLAGTAIALEAMERARAERGEPLTEAAVQRFFVARARMSRAKHRPEHLRQWLMTQPHAPGRYRVNLIAQHLDAFHRAFGTAPGDGMWRAPGDRVRIW